MLALVIDDSRSIRAFLTRILSSIGFAVVLAEDGLQGLEQLRASWPVDLALVDWNMPNMNGLEFLEEVRGSAQYATMKILMATSETDMQRIQDALDAGADDYVMKPFTKDILVAKLKMIGIEV